MKKILSLLLSITLLLSCHAGISASAATDGITDADEALALLTYMDMIESDEDISSNITRAEFASLVAKAIKTQPTSGKQYYIDVEADFWAFDSISALTELGYISGGDNVLFRPNDSIRLSEASKIVTSMVGYGALCEAKGGYPAGYLQVAASLDIIDNISGEFITKEQAYVMLYRAINTPLYVPTAISENGIKYDADDNSTILSLYHDIYYIEGTVNAVGAMSLVSSASLQEGQALIGNKTLRTNEISLDMYDYLGVGVVGYYIETNGRNASLIVMIPDGEANSATTIAKDDVTFITDDGGYYTFNYYDENNRDKSIKVSRGCVVIKNGESITTDLYNEFSISKGSYKFLDYNNDKKIDVLFVNEYYNLVVGLIENSEGMIYITTENNTEYYRGQIGSRRVIYDKFDSSLSVDVTEDSDKIIKFKNADGSLCTIDDVALNEVLSIYKSSDGKYIEVVKGSAALNGTVEEISYPDSNTIIFSIGGSEYDMDSSVLEIIPEKLVVGFSGTFYLDAFGKIGYYTVSNDATILFGYLTKVGRKQSGLDNTVYLEIFSQDNILGTYTCHDKAVIDGSGIMGNLDKAYELLSPYAKQMIRFTANENSEVTFVDTLNNVESQEGEKSIKETLSFGKYLLAASRGSFTQTEVLSANTIVFVVPTDETIESGNYDETKFIIKKRNELRADTYYNASTYRVNPHGAFEDVILNKRDTSFEALTFIAPVMISEIKTIINDKGDAVNSIVGYSNKTPTKYETIDTSVLKGYNLSKGDIVWFEQDLEGKIVSVIDVLVKTGDSLIYKIENSKSNDEKFYSKSVSVTHGGPDKLSNSTLESSFCVLYGYAAEVVDGVIRFAYTKEDCENGNYLLARNISSKPVIVYDKESTREGNIYWSSASDIIDYKKGGDACSNVVIFMRQNAVQCVYVYK